MAELKPCPFCGGIARICDHKFYNGKTKDFSYHNYGVKCIVCFAQIWQFYNTKEEAVDAWNRRTDNG